MSSVFEHAVLSEERRLLRRSVVIAVLLYAGVVLLLSARGWLTGLQSAQVEAPTLEAELVPAQPAAPKLYEAKSAKTQTVVHEKTVSLKAVSKTQAAAPAQPVAEPQNQTVAGGPPAEASHGPQVQSAPAPKLPSYLKDQNLKTSVLIEFLVSAQGVTTPSLIGSSGNEEVDALALRAAQKWVFRPAQKDGQPTDAKVRLRINFEVD